MNELNNPSSSLNIGDMLPSERPLLQLPNWKERIKRITYTALWILTGVLLLTMVVASFVAPPIALLAGAATVITGAPCLMQWHAKKSMFRRFQNAITALHEANLQITAERSTFENLQKGGPLSDPQTIRAVNSRLTSLINAAKELQEASAELSKMRTCFDTEMSELAALCVRLFASHYICGLSLLLIDKDENPEEIKSDIMNPVLSDFQAYAQRHRKDENAQQIIQQFLLIDEHHARIFQLLIEPVWAADV